MSRIALIAALGAALWSAPCRARVDTSIWLGSAYTPAGASNTLWWPWFDRYEAAIDRELGFAAARLKFNALRVFLHTLVYEANATALLNSVDRFLAIAAMHGMRTGLVLFDACWGTAGADVTRECTPTKGVHNGCWFESPEVNDMTSVGRYERYVTDVVARFGSDPRVLYIEVYNEPRGPGEVFVFALRDAAFRWASALQPTAPILSCWDDNNNTEVVDHHDYTPNFASSWAPSLYANAAKGSVVTEGGSRWFQPPFPGDYGSPLTAVNFLQALRREHAAGRVDFVPGAMLNWELTVGNTNTRWHWGSPAGVARSRRSRGAAGCSPMARRCRTPRPRRCGASRPASTNSWRSPSSSLTRPPSRTATRS